MKRDKIISDVSRLVRDNFPEIQPIEKGKIPLNIRSYGAEEVCGALEVLFSGQVAMGEKVKKFENIFAEYIGVKHAAMVNSGSSANLIALSALTNPLMHNKISEGSEIITPAVTFPTTVYPIIQTGAIPVLVDVEHNTMNIDPTQIERAITPKTRAIMPVHLLGNPCKMDEILDIAEAHDLYLIEDSCEAHGAEHKGKKVGSFGDINTFSFFFSHHITTLEGGMILTDNEELAELARSLRVFGWIRDLTDKDAISQKHNHIDPRYTFINIGYNLRPTEIQGVFGIHQMKKLENYIQIKRKNSEYWNEHLKQFSYLKLYNERENTKHVWYGYPITVKHDAPFSREELTRFLETKGVETRPIMAGNMAEQPVMQHFKHKTIGDLRNSRYIMRNSFFFGNHHGIGQSERELIVNYISEFMRGT